MGIGVGIIGTGMMGLEHLRNLALVPDAELVALADPAEESRRWARLAAGEGPEIYEDYRALLARDDVDAVIIGSPNHTHIDVMRDVFTTAKHVLVEKPLCTTLADAIEVRDRAAKHPGVVFVGMEYRYMPPVARLIREVHGGAVGRLRMLAIREHRFPFLPKVGDWNRFNRNTGGTLVEKCCHFFDLMNLIVGSEPVRVLASGGQDVNHLDERYGGETPDILDNAFTIVEYANGVRALLDLCMFAEASRNEQEISATGDSGKLECFVPEYSVVLGRRQPRDVRVETVPVEKRLLDVGFHHGSTYYEQLAFLDAIKTGKPPEVDAEQGLRAVALGLAAQESIATGQPVPFPVLR